uniref:Uncharacterized protein n=1 Tax=Neospora caninum (strain Liverpool) TaxID=572307 RepID=A0A0F7UHC1_NEOCL|nr:TPA: hypothetical protein BN1204_034590 [Neospora caninum Liverpool]
MFSRKLLVQYRIAARILARRLEEREERERRQAALEEEASKQAAAEEQQSRQEMLYSLFQSLRKQRNEQLLASRSASQEAASFRVTSPSATADPASPRSSSALCAAGSASSSFASSSTMSTTPGAVEEGESGRPLKAHDADQERRVPDEKLSWSTCKPHHAADQFSSAENKHKLWTGIDLGETSLALSCLPERRSSTTTGSNGEEEKEEEEEERDGGEEEEGDEKEELEEKGGKEETGGSRLHILACDELDALHLGQTKLTTRLAFQGETRDAQAGASEDFPLKTVRAESKECTSSDARGDADFRLPRSPVRHRRSEITVATSGSVFTHVTTCASSSNPPSVPVPLCEETPSTCLPHRPAASSPPLPSSFSAVSSCSSSSASSSASPSPSASSLFPSLSSSASSSSSFASSSSPSKWLLPAALQSSPENAPPENLPGGAAKRVFESKSEASGVRTRPFGAREKRTTPAFDVNPFLGLLSNSDPGVTPAMQEEREDAFASSHPLMNRAIQQTSQTRDSAGHDQPGDESEGFSKSSVPALSHHVQHSLPLPQKSPHALTSPSSFAPSSSSSSYPASSSTSFLPLTLPHTPLPSVLPLAAFLPPSFPGQPCPSARPGADSVLGEHQRNGDTLPRLIFGETPGSPGRSLPEKLATSDRSLERYTVPAAQRRKLQKGDGEGKGAFDAERCDPRAEGASLRRQETVRKSCRKRGENRIENVDPSASAGRPRRHEEQRNRRLYQTGKCENPDLRARAKAIWLSQQEDLKTILGVHSPRQGSRDFRRVR